MAANGILIPVHWPKANWLISFLLSLQAQRAGKPAPGFAIILAVSNFHEQTLFSRLLTALFPTLPVVFFCVEDYLLINLESDSLLHRLRGNTDSCVVNLKKFAGLHWACGAGYKKLACVDADIFAWTDLEGLFDALDSNYDTGLYFATTPPAPVHQQITENCAHFFSDADAGALARLTHEGRRYSWFFDVPYYRADDLAGFFDYMAAQHGGLADWLGKLSWYSFEHIIFQYYRILYHQAQLVDCVFLDMEAVLENASAHDAFRVRGKYGYSPAWISAPRTLSDPAAAKGLEGIHLLVHFDRF